MADTEDGFEDSGTAEVGRKRDLQEFSNDIILAELSGGAHKHAKADNIQEDILIANPGLASSAELSTSTPKNVTKLPGMDESDTNQPQTIQPPIQPSSVAWNTSVQGGLRLRTSFRDRARVETLVSPTNAVEKETKLWSAEEHLNLPSTTQVSPPALSRPDSAAENRSRNPRDMDLSESRSGSSSEDELHDEELKDEDYIIPEAPAWFVSGTFKKLDLKAVSELSKGQRQQYKKDQKAAKLVSNTAKVDYLLAKYRAWPLEDKKLASMVSTGKTLYPRLPSISKVVKSLQLPGIILHNGLPIKGPDFSFEAFVLALLAENISQVDTITSKLASQCFKQYLPAYYGHIGSPSLQRLTEESQRSFSIDDARLQIKTLAFKEQSSAIIKNPRGNDLVIENTARESSIIPIQPVERPTRASDAERALQEKYYPTGSNEAHAYPCLTCAKMGHHWSECLALSCTLCGTGQHSDLMCPHRKRCGKCREGHLTFDCPQKLLLAPSESSPCDICGSRDHQEIACHYIWRSFDPGPDEVLKVREIPIFCYLCGSSSHYGTECGLNRRPLLSGGVTWSRANHQKYVDPAVHAQALSAGKDYSIPPRAFNIKGKANISELLVDDSDNDDSFIRPRVPLPQPGQSGTIRFGDKNNFMRGNSGEYRRDLGSRIRSGSTFDGSPIDQLNSMRDQRSFSGYNSQSQEPPQSMPQGRRENSGPNHGKEASQRGGLSRRGSKKKRIRGTKPTR